LLNNAIEWKEVELPEVNLRWMLFIRWARSSYDLWLG